MANYTNYADELDIETGDKLAITLAADDGHPEQDGHMTAIGDQHDGGVNVEDKNGNGLWLDLRQQDIEYRDDAVVGRLESGRTRIANLTRVEVA